MIVEAKLELRLIAAGEAVMTAVRAAAIWVQRPVERHPFHGVQRGPAGNLLVSRSVGSTLCLIERRFAPGANVERQRPRGRRPLSEVEYQRLLRHGVSFAVCS